MKQKNVKGINFEYIKCNVCILNKADEFTHCVNLYSVQRHRVHSFPVRDNSGD